MTATLHMFVACAPGLEPLLADEVRALGAGDAQPCSGGVELTGDRGTLYRANLELGLALKVLVRLGGFRARRFPALVREVAALPWTDWLAGDTEIDVRVTARRSRLYHTKAIAERVRAGIDAALERTSPSTPPPASAPAPADAPRLTVHARLDGDDCTLSVDTSGEPLHKRGYRLATGKAPLREDLARALVIASGWDRAGAFADPMCGAGTIAIEAAWLAANVAPGHLRDFAFMDAPTFDAALWQRTRDAARAAARSFDLSAFVCSDRDAGAIDATRANAARAGLAGMRIERASLSEAPAFDAAVAGGAGAPGALVTNPPYGGRVGRGDLRPLYQTLGARCRALSGWRIGVAAADRRLAAATGLPLESALMTDHGGRKVYLMTGRVPA